MEWTKKSNDKETVITISGTVDFEEVEEFQELLQKEAAREKSIILDLRNCDNLCSMAVGVILGMKIECSLHSADLWMVNASQRIRDIFSIISDTGRLFMHRQGSPA